MKRIKPMIATAIVGLLCLAYFVMPRSQKSQLLEKFSEGKPVISVEEPPPPPGWHQTIVMTEEEADIDPEPVLPQKLKLIEYQNVDLEFAKAQEPPKPKRDPTTPPTREELLLFIARNSISREDWADAEKFFEQLIAANPKNPEYRLEFAEYLIGRSKKPEAAKQLDAAKEGVKGKDALETRFAQALGKLDRWPEAVALLKSIADRDPKNQEAAKRYAEAAEKLKGKPPVSPTPIAPPPDEGARLKESAKNATAKGNHQEASDFWLQFLRKHPGSTVELVEAVKSFRQTGNAEGAKLALERLAKVKPTNEVEQLLIAELLAQPTTHEPENRPTEQPPPPPVSPSRELELVLEKDPQNHEARLGLARLKLQAFDVDAAVALLAETPPDRVRDRDYLLTLSWYHVAIGEFGEAKCVLDQILAKDEEDTTARLALGDTYYAARDYHRALAEFSKIPPGTVNTYNARLGTAAALVKLKMYHDAIALSESLLNVHPDDPQPISLIADSLAASGDCEAAIGRLNGWLASAHSHPDAQDLVRLTLAKMLMLQGRKADARSEFEAIQRSSVANNPVVVWGLWALRFEPHGPDDRKQPFPEAPLTNVGFAAAISDYLIELHRRDDAIVILEKALESKPDDLVLLNRLADARALGRTRDDKFAAMHAYMRVQTLSASNTHAIFGYARSAKSAGLFEEAIHGCDRLIHIDPNDTPARLLKARTLFAMGCRQEADAVYAQIAQIPAEQQLRERIGELCQAVGGDVSLRLVPTLTCEAEAMRLALDEVAAINPALRPTLQRLAADYDAACNVRNAASMERRVKCNTTWAPIVGVEAGVIAVSEDRTNAEVAFDLAQNYSELGESRMAESMYREALKRDPGSREAAIAADRLDLEHGSQIRIDASYEHSRGREGRADIERFRMMNWLTFNTGDADEYLAGGIGIVNYKPTDDGSLTGEVYSVRAQYKPADLVLVHAQINAEMYPNRFTDRATFDVGARWRGTDRWQVRGSAFGQNVVESGESMRQDIHREGFTVGGDWFHSPWVEFGGTYRWSNYSDDNAASEIDLYYWHRLALWPSELKFIADFHFWNYDEDTVFPFGPGGPLFGATHPYFAPGGYSITAAHLDWQRVVSRDSFLNANLTTIGARAGLGIDTLGDGFFFGRLMFHRDVCYWLSLDAELATTQSNDYRVVSAFAYLTARLRNAHKTCWLSCGDDYQ